MGLLAALVLLAAPAMASATQVTVAPAGSSPGTGVTLGGSGFAPLSPITITFDTANATTSPSSVTTDLSGSFSGVTVTIPSDAIPGSHTIAASDGSNNASSPVAVDTVSVSPTSGPAGAGLTVTGAGWTANDSVGIQIGGASVCTLTADGSGNISGDQSSNGCQVPSGASGGPQPVTASDPTAGTQAQGGNFTVTPTASFTATSPIDLGSATQLDASASGEKGGTITHYLWNFGDGQSENDTGPKTSHTYAATGTYTVTLTVVDAFGNTGTATQSVAVQDEPPSAAFTPPAEAPSGSLLQFSGTGSNDPDGSIVTYDWNWGDGTAHGSGATPTHSYTSPGTYNVTLTVTDSSGHTASASHAVVVDNRPPAASFTGPSSQAVGTSAAFDGTGSSDPDGSVVSYDWSWGDGTADGTTATPHHTFSRVGTFPVTLTVTDNSGATNSVTHDVTVTGSNPIAAFSPPAEQPTGTSLGFDGSGSSTPNAGATITSYDWNWGDGTAHGSGAKPTHSYATAGTYPVTLTVTDSTGETGTITHSVVVDDRAPTASFSAPSSGTVGSPVPFDATGSGDPDGTISSYDWNWGDGTTNGSGAKPSHTYTKVGAYTVTLTVTDNSGNKGSVSQTISVTGAQPNAAFTVPAAAPTGTVLNFDGSGSTGTPSSTITSYDWGWGDGSAHSSGAKPTHSYTTAGTYHVTLTVTDSAGQTNSVTHDVVVTDRAPSATFTPSSASVPTGTPVAFDGTGSNDPDGTLVSYSWSFGDGSGSNAPTPSHAYATAGTYTVTLVVTDNSGNTSTATHSVTVTDRPPSAAFNPTSATVLAGSGVSFDGTPSNDPDGSITGYSWNFGDHGSSSAAQPNHTYQLPGTYTVTLTVTDNAGNSSAVSHQITVIAPPPVQTLVENVVPAPGFIKFGAPVLAAGGVDLGRRVFCPSSGPSCQTTIKATSKVLATAARKRHSRASTAAGSGSLTTPANGSSKLRFKLSPAAIRWLRTHGRLPLKVSVVSVRGGLQTTSVFTTTVRR